MVPIRILQEVTFLGTGGVETLLMNIYRNIDRSKIQFDFMTHREKGVGFYEKEIEELGGKIYSGIPFNPVHHTKYLKSLDNFFEKHQEYKIIHAHNAFSMFTLRSAMKHGVPVRIAHSHNARPKLLHYKTPFKYYAKSKIKKYATDMFACSNLAGKYYYGKKAMNAGKVVVMKNGIDTNKFKFNDDVRRKIRNELNLNNNTIAIVHIGRFDIQKNHEFLIDIFNSLVAQNKNYKLFLFGEGELESKVKQKVNEFGISDNVIFMGVNGNVNEYLQAMDLFILPSLFEGLPLTGIEAQTSGLPCLFADTITKETKITENVEFISIKETPKYWADKIINMTNKQNDRKDSYLKTIEAGYDVKEIASKIQEFYLRKYNEVREEENAKS